MLPTGRDYLHIAEVRNDRRREAEAYRLRKTVDGASPLQIKLQGFFGRIGGEIEKRWLESFKEKSASPEETSAIGSGVPSFSQHR
jgi:hypothetical protein